MNVTQTLLPGVLLIEPRVHGDRRGFFLETFHADRYAEAGIRETFVQDNLSASSRGVLRGLHAQSPRAQGKLLQVIEGEIFDVALDIRLGSPTFGRWVGEILSDENHRQLYVPAGCAHGFQVLSERAVVAYKCTAPYHPEDEFTVLWNDPDIGIGWPGEGDPILSAKDLAGVRLKDLDEARLLPYEAD